MGILVAVVGVGRESVTADVGPVIANILTTVGVAAALRLAAGHTATVEVTGHSHMVPATPQCHLFTATHLAHAVLLYAVAMDLRVTLTAGALPGLLPQDISTAVEVTVTVTTEVEVVVIAVSVATAGAAVGAHGIDHTAAPHPLNTTTDDRDTRTCVHVNVLYHTIALLLVGVSTRAVMMMIMMIRTGR